MIADQYADTVADSKQQVIRAARKMLRANEALETARIERDEALAVRLGDLMAEGMGLFPAMDLIREELRAVFSEEEVQKIGVSNSVIRQAARWQKRR